MASMQQSNTRVAASSPERLSGSDLDGLRPAKAVIAGAIAGSLARSLDGPIIPMLMKLSGPTVLVLIVQTFVGVAETYFVSFLGTDALAGVALVFPVLMLMTMMSNGGVGGGVASAVARAVGAGRMQDADALVMHAIVLAILFGLAFTIGILGFGRALYSALGGSGDALTAALQYSSFVFGGAALAWIVNLLQASLRGAGDVRIPALVIFAGRRDRRAAVARADLRDRSAPAARHRRRRRGGRDLLRARDGCTDGLHAFDAKPGEARADPAGMATLQGHPQRWRYLGKSERSRRTSPWQSLPQWLELSEPTRSRVLAWRRVSTIY